MVHVLVLDAGIDSYIQRLKDLEDIAYGFGGAKAYAIQAGRELRVIVESEKVNDDKAAQLSFEISQKSKRTWPIPTSESNRHSGNQGCKHCQIV